MNVISILMAAVLGLALAGCGSTPTRQAKTPTPAPTAPQGGGYYLDDGPEATPPANLDAIPDAVPRDEPLHRFANRTYTALGNTYTPRTTRRGFSEEGLASWYGRRFHGRKTASGEVYDMYAMTAAHPTLPIPSYARVTALNSGKSVVVRINDRGPFHSKRVIDLSYTSAHKLGYIRQGSTRVRVESIDPASHDTQGDALGEGLFLQVGAFSSADNAQRLRERLTRELALDAGRTRVVLNDRLHRVQLGPYPSDVDAHADRDRVRERLDLNAVLLRRD
ncbi:MAG: septal ring lytic transglycosylase RlpA family protein [Thiobacillus sp.]|nr:septal ring lytic transglycosylase RlpA family protein [Thiobacillus sp.]